MIDLISKVGGILGIIGAIILYFERMQFNRLDAERKLSIAAAELNDLFQRRERDHGIARARRLLPDNPNMVVARPYEQNENNDSLQEAKLEADIEYYRALIQHSFFWFIPKIMKKIKNFKH